MKYTFKNNRWFAQAYTDKAINKPVVLMDTGAQVTALSVESVADLKRWTVKETIEFLKPKALYNVVVADGSKIPATPCCLQNVTVADELIKNFFCMVALKPNSLKLNLIGADMLNAYSRVEKDDNCFILSGLDSRKHAKYFRRRCEKVFPTWLGSIQITLLVDDIVDLKVYAPNCVEWATRHNYNKEAFRLALFKVIDKYRITTLEALEAIIAEIDK